MELRKLNVKFFVAEPDRLPLTDFIDVFHSWIRATDGIYYDVADYSHMTAGPGIVLVAHEANVSIDETGGRRGLLLNYKQPLAGSNDEKLRSVFRRALENCRQLEEESALKGKLKFRGDEALFLINDRLIAPNRAEIFAEVRPELEKLAHTLFGGVGYTLKHDPRKEGCPPRGFTPDPRQRFSVALKSAKPFDVAALLRNLSANGDALSP